MINLREQRALPASWALLPILVVAAVLRVAAQYAESTLPLFTHYRLDELIYDQAGKAVAGGDLTLGRDVWHMSPLYSYFVGLIYATFGTGPWPVRLVQACFGVGTVALVYASANLLAGRRAAILAAGVAALYGPLVFYESLVLADSLSAFLHALLAFCLLRAVTGKDEAFRSWAGLGVVWGAATLLRPTALLCIVPIAIAWWFVTRGLGALGRGKPACVLLLTAAVTIAPATVRNYLVAGELILVTDSGGLNFYLGNGPGAIGTFRVPRELPGATNAVSQFSAFRAAAERDLGKKLGSREVDRYWFGKTWDEIAARPGRFLLLLVEKTWLFWNAGDLPNTQDYAFHRQINPVLGWPLFQFWLISPLALIGTFALFLRRRPAEIVLGSLLVVLFFSQIAFFILGHYRIVMLPLLIVAATIGLGFVGQAVQERRYRALGLVVALLCIALPMTFTRKHQRSMDDEYFKLGYAYQVQGDRTGAEVAYLKALAINADNISAHKNLGLLYERALAFRESCPHWEEVARLAAQPQLASYAHDAQMALARCAAAAQVMRAAGR